MRYFFISLISLSFLGLMAISCSRPDVDVLASANNGQSLQAGSEVSADWFAIVGQFHNDGLAAFADSSFAGLSTASFAALSATKAVGEYAAFWNAEGGGQLSSSATDSLRLVYASRPVVPGLA